MSWNTVLQVMFAHLVTANFKLGINVSSLLWITDSFSYLGDVPRSIFMRRSLNIAELHLVRGIGIMDVKRQLNYREIFRLAKFIIQNKEGQTFKELMALMPINRSFKIEQ